MSFPRESLRPRKSRCSSRSTMLTRPALFPTRLISIRRSRNSAPVCGNRRECFSLCSVVSSFGILVYDERNTSSTEEIAKMNYHGKNLKAQKILSFEVLSILSRVISFREREAKHSIVKVRKSLSSSERSNKKTDIKYKQ